MLLTYLNDNGHTGTISSVYKYNYSLNGKHDWKTNNSCDSGNIGDTAPNIIITSVQLMARYANYNKLQLILRSMKQQYNSIIVGIWQRFPHQSACQLVLQLIHIRCCEYFVLLDCSRFRGTTPEKTKNPKQWHESIKG